ncbi:4'-phosphopantetheinyl transferase superfamily protein [Mycoplasma sp. Ms02]|uniref:4'-phosphopantetheinyl transferase superfamily protein n=1 Tax=Mycoplasma sp. Ms02 TaxID=353851 RepID=UPI001C8971A2|nr:4'-phosphopantetheinyl transferase superfamily protein [Mycoplasma sp. Ms02]QZE12556.1 4'-phosphopantetheinyl transferase superfamily protein [Mycoplasma sp. Ms02]
MPREQRKRIRSVVQSSLPSRSDLDFAIGVDFTKISRFEKNHILMSTRILTDNQKKIYDKLGDENQKIRYIAKNWAAKEAIFKCDNNYYQFNEIDVNFEIKPVKYRNFSISITHDDGYLVAVVHKQGV